MKTNLKKPFQKSNTGIIIILILIVLGVFWAYNNYSSKIIDYKFTGFGLSEAENEFITCYVKAQEDICSDYSGEIVGFKMPVCEFPEKYETIGEVKLGEALASCNKVYLEALNNTG